MRQYEISRETSNNTWLKEKSLLLIQREIEVVRKLLTTMQFYDSTQKIKLHWIYEMLYRKSKPMLLSSKYQCIAICQGELTARNWILLFFLIRDVSCGSKFSQIVPTWDTPRSFSEQILVHYRLVSNNILLISDRERSRICSIWGQPDQLWVQIRPRRLWISNYYCWENRFQIVDLTWTNN